MRSRPKFWVLLCLLVLAGAWFFWPAGGRKVAQNSAAPAPDSASVPYATVTRSSASTAPVLFAAAKNSTNLVSVSKTNPFPYRLSNTTKSISELAHDRRAILLENALIDTGAKLDLGIPKNLSAAGDPGAYIVQASGPADAAFRAKLTAAGAEIISYIPNNAYLVRVSASGANQLAALTQAVIPYEPYYKVQSPLLAYSQKALPVGAELKLGLFAAGSADTLAQIAKLGGTVLATDRSPFGPIVRVSPPKNWTALAGLPGVQIVEGYHPRKAANDLSRATVGVAVDSVTNVNYLNLSGSNVLVQVNDSGIDATHPDLIGRIFGSPGLLVDTNGHGTFVAGIIGGDGTESMTVTNAQGSIMPGTNGQFRGKAPLAHLLSVSSGNSDQVLQELAGFTNALISNNSWNYGGDNAYDLAAASYDAASRDSLTQLPGSQPVLYVFSSGNAGGGNNDGGGGDPDTILSPATAKNVITVGALEQLRNITNIVTDPQSNSAAVWQPPTDSDFQVAGFSSRGNVGVGTEGPSGRIKPDVVAPGTFVVSTRSQQWDEVAYYNPSNSTFNSYRNQTVGTNGVLNPYSISVPANAVAVIISIVPNVFSRLPFPTNLPIYVEQAARPTTATYDFVMDGGVSIPPDSGGAITGIQSIQNDGFYYGVGNTNNYAVNYDLITQIITTNDLGDYFLVLSNLNNSLGYPPYYYRYESGTSMAAADASGTLALMQDFFKNTLNTTPSPGLLKAMLINGARVTGNYNFYPANTVNYEGWGLINLPNSLPLSITNFVANPTSTNLSIFILDQSVTNALATGDSQTFTVTVDTNTASSLPLRVTLAWTDPAGNPAAAIKLVNNLDLIVTNLDTGEVFFGNDIPASSVFNAPWNTNGVQNLDYINNVENVFLAPDLGSKYSVTVLGRGVNVNAVTAQTNNPAGVYAPNVVQDFSLVISCGDGTASGAITVAANPVVSHPTTSQLITYVVATNTPLLDQFVGANTPLMGTNTIAVGTNTSWATNGAITLGMTNQWHFYAVTNTLGYQYAAFITFLPATLSLPRTGVYADSLDNSTQPEADIDMYVTDPHNPNILLNGSDLTNLSPVIISASDKSLTQGGVEFVTYSNSALNDVYYIGVKSEAQEGSEFGFVSLFSQNPFSNTDKNGNEYVQGVPLPVWIPDGSTKHPGKAYVFAIATSPIQIENVVVTNTILHENFGDLIGVLSHNGKSTVLNNHAGQPNPPGPYTKIYDDSGRGVIAGAQPSDGPGTLQSFRGQQGVGPWILTEVDDSLVHTGAVTGLQLFIEKHNNLAEGITVSIPPGSWFYTFIDVPGGYTNLLISATNLTPVVSPPLQLYLNYGFQPDFSNYLDFVLLTNPPPTSPGNSISYGPPLRSGTYYVGIFNPSFSTANAYLIGKLSGLESAPVPASTTTNGPALLDDAVNSSTFFVTSTQQVASVNVGVVVNHPRVSDLTFTLLSPTGQRVLLMENRGGATTNGAGDIFFTTNNFAPITATGSGLPQTNFLDMGKTSGTLLVNWDMFGVPDEMTVYYGTNYTTFGTNNPGSTLLFDTGLVSGAGATNLVFGPGTSTFVTIIMNEFGNPAGANGTRWTYTVGGIQTNYNYLMFTDDTNKTTLPVKFAVPPFILTASGTNYTLSDFDALTNGDYLAPTNIFDAHGGWNLTNITQVLIGTNLVMLTNNQNLVSVVTDPVIASSASNFLALASGSIFRQIPMTPGRQFSLSFQYRGPGISGWWRGEGDATDSSDPEVNGNNGWLIGRFNFPAGEVGQAFALADAGSQFQFAGTNTYVQIHQTPFRILVSNGETNPPVPSLSSDLDVGIGSGLTVEGWINPTNVSFQMPLVEWLAGTPTNLAGTNVVIAAGPFLNPSTLHYYYLLGTNTWTTSETWAKELGGHLVTLDTVNEQNWVYDTFANYGGVNRNLWIGLTNNPPGLVNFTWSSGLTNPAYFNWLSGQPTNCNGNNIYTVMLGLTNGQPGLWMLMDNTGHTCTLLTNKNYGVVEVDDLQPNGVQFWVSVTNAPGSTNQVAITNGCLFANLVDTTNGSHYVYSAPGLVQSNVFQHVALTYNTNSGLACLYYNGTNVASTNLGYFLPKTTGDVLIGKDMSRATNNFFGGRMDEMSIYSRSLSSAEIRAIYNVSALTTNRTIGKFDQSVTPALGLAEAGVSFGVYTNLLLGLNNSWQSQSYSFTATTSSVPLQITGLEPGMLLDSFNVSEEPLGNLYYFPEQPLAALNGNSAYGTWELQVLDNRTGAYITNSDQLVSWQLQIVLQNNALPSVAVGSEEATTISVPPGEIVDLTVTVPLWAKAATNVLVSSTLPVDLLFNQTNAPTGSVFDYTLLTGSTAGFGVPTLTVAPPSVPPLLPGQTYHLGVRNPGAHSATVVIRVDYDITALTNGVPVSDVLQTNATDEERYFVYNVSTNAYAATFQLLNLSSNADLVVRKGTPLPTLISSDYGSFNATNADEAIYVLTNSSPVPLSAGNWYLGVFRRSAGPVQYTVLAKELDTPTPAVVPLTNGVPFTFTAGPGAALTNFFRFTVTNSPPSVSFQLYNMTGNGDLTVQTNALPLAPPFYQSSQQPGLTPEFISIYTNSAQTNLNTTALTNLNQEWYLGVPNHYTNSISYTILAVIGTNSVFPAFPGAEGAGAGALGGGSLPSRNGGITNTVYHVINLSDSGAGSLRDAVSSTNRTIVFDVSGTINLQDRLIITNSYLTIAGQTAPGGGITVAGWETRVQDAHDVVIRYVRFRPSNFDALRFISVSNVIADHVSAEWSPLLDTAVLDSANLTVQWSMITDNLFAPGTPNAGTLLRFGDGALTFHHNLYANNYAGNPHLDDNLSLDFVNNVIYGWGTNSGTSFDPTNNPVNFTNRLNYVCNYLIANSNSFASTIAFRGGSTNTWIFQTNNVIDSNTNGIVDGADTGWDMFTNRFTKIGQPFPLPPVTTDEAYRAYERVLDFAGLSLMARDSVDTNIVTGVRNQTGTIISTAGVNPAIVSTQSPLDSDQDGIPNYWEITFNQFPTNVSDYLPSPTAPGYTDLEEYLNWLAAPHALTITNTPVSVDLLQLFGNTGNLSFEVTNSVNGLVYLTNVLVSATGSVTNTGPFSNSIAVFTPTNNAIAGTNFYGYAAFDVTVTNNDTFAYFGPVTVSVVVSSEPIVYGTINTNAPAFSTNLLGNVAINELTLMTVTNTATDPDTNQTLAYAVTMVVDTASMIASNWPLTFATTIPSPIISTNGIITWTPTELQGPGVYIITTVVTDSGIPPLSATNSFTVTVNEVNLAPVLPVQTNRTISATTTLIVTNTATDADIPTNSLTYALTVSPPATNAVISVNGIITWTPNPTQVGLFTFTTIVTDTNAYALVNQSLTATNVFTVLVTPVAAPFVFSQPAQAVTGTGARLNGMVTPNGLPTLAWFEWGTSTAYTNVTTPVSVGAGYNVVYTSNNIGGLTLNVPYHFRVVAANAAGTNYGFDQILDEANVVVWGANYVGQGNVPAGLSNVTAIAGAYDHSLALKINSTVVSWGNNTLGYLTVPANLTNVLAVAGGEYYSMALKNNGTVTAWGANVFPGQTNVPAGLSNVVTIAGGTFSSIALKNNGSVVAWGANIFGVTNVPPNASNTVAVAGGFFHSLAIKNDGTVFGWGDNSAGQLNVPAGVTNAVAVAAGNAHSLALKYDGTVVAWGDNGDGQTDVPPGLTNVVAIAAGGFNSMALKNDGKIVTWGDNTTGQSSVPVGLTNAVAIAGGNLHSLALTPQSFASLTNPVVLPIVNGVPQTNNILPGGITYYQVDVPANATIATNSLLFASGPLNVWFTTNVPPTIAKTNDSLLLGALTNGVSVLSTTSVPTNIIPGRTYYLGVQNTNSATVNYAIEVDFHLVMATNPPISIASIIYTNIASTNGFLLTWFAPSNDLFQVQWTTSLSPASWTAFTNPPTVSYNTNVPVGPTNAQFNFFDNASQTGGTFGPSRFYRLILLGSQSNLPIGPAQTNSVAPGTTAYFPVNVPTNADFATNTLLFAAAPMNLLFNQTGFPVGTNAGNVTLLGNSTGGTSILSAVTAPPLVPGATYYLGVQNTNSVAVTFALSVNFHLSTNAPSGTGSISSITATNNSGTNAFLLTWFAPTNDLFQVQWNTNLASTNWSTFTNVIAYNLLITPTSSRFNFLDDGSQTGGTLGSSRFYRLILLAASANTLTLPVQTNFTVSGPTLVTVTNTATDSNTNALLTYSLLSSPTNASISTNGIITWTNAAPNGLAARFTTLVTDNGAPLASATNTFTIFVAPLPAISSVTATATNVVLNWSAPTNDLFQVRWTTNLVTPVFWTTFPQIITSSTGLFTFTDTNAPLLMKFYQLILLP